MDLNEHVQAGSEEPLTRRERGANRRVTALAAAFTVFLFISLGFAVLPYAIDSPKSISWSGSQDTGSAIIAQVPGEPSANAGDDQTVSTGRTVVLNGSLSTDDVGIVNYTWTFYDSGQQTLYGSLTSYVFIREGIYSVTLNVTDTDGNHDTDVAVITVVYVPPVANAGTDRIVYQGTPVVFNASASSGGVVNYTWTFVHDGEDIALHGIVASYVFLKNETYNVTLTVRDYADVTSEDTVTIDVRRIVAEAGRNQTITTGATANFNASGSAGVELSYVWNFTYDGKEVVLHGVNPSFAFNKSGTYVVTLTVRTPANITANDTMVLTVSRIPTWLEENWLKVTIWSLILAAIVYALIGKWRRDHAIIASTDMDKIRLQWGSAKRIWKSFIGNSKGIVGLMLLLAFVAIALLAEPLYVVGLIQNPSLVTEASSGPQLAPPSWSHLLGTDEKGRDVLSEIFYGSRTSLTVGFAAAILTIVLGAGVGLMAGASGRAVDELLMRITDVFLVIPWLPFAVILASFLPPLNQPSMYKIIIVIGVTSWPAAARIVRSQVLSIRERSFIERATAVGAGRLHIMRKHLLPNVFPLVFANAILSVSYAILSEAFLAFFGISDLTKVTWGSMLYNAFNFGGFANNAYWYVLPPGICIILVVLGFTFVSYALDDILNPKLRRR